VLEELLFLERPFSFLKRSLFLCKFLQVFFISFMEISLECKDSSFEVNEARGFCKIKLISYKEKGKEISKIFKEQEFI